MRARPAWGISSTRRAPASSETYSVVISTTAAGRRPLDRAVPAVRRAYDALFVELTVSFGEIEASIDELNRALDAALEKRRRGGPRRHRYA